MQSDAEVVVEARDVTKHWGATLALDGVTASIGHGVTGLLGANGAGKTSFLRLVLGQHALEDGELKVLGRDAWRDGTEVRSHVGYSPEHEALPPDVRAQDMVRHMAEIHGLPRQAALERASSALDEVGLAEERFRAVGTMSTGQKQRVKLAQAIAHDPDLLLLDEPTNGLDPVQREGMLRLIERIASEFGIDVVVSSHLLGEVERICDSVVLLTNGRVAASGRLDALKDSGDAVAVEVGRGRDRLAERLASAGVAVRVEGDDRVVLDGGDHVVDLVRDLVAELQLPLRRLQPQASSLEDLFVRFSQGRQDASEVDS